MTVFPVFLSLAMMSPLVQAGTDWPVFFEHLGRVHSIHNKWEVTFAVKTNFRTMEQKLLNISRQIKEFQVSGHSFPYFFAPGSFDLLHLHQPALEEEAELEFAADVGDEENTEEDRLFRLVNEHWEGLADLLAKRSGALLKRLGDYRSYWGRINWKVAGAAFNTLRSGFFFFLANDGVHNNARNPQC